MKKILIIALGICITSGIVLLLLFISRPGIIKNTPQPGPTITSPNEVEDSPLSTLLIPTASPENGGGVDENAPQIKASIAQIEKLLSFLPYTKIQTLSTQRQVEIIVSPPDKSRPWVLPVFIGGIDFQVPEQTPVYNQTRLEFREAAQHVFDWMKTNNADSTLIFVNWGDRAYIQERAEAWLQ